MDKAILKNGKIHKLSELGNSVGRIVGLRRLSNQQLFTIGFRPISEPDNIPDGMQKGDLYYNESEGIFEYNLIPATQGEIDESEFKTIREGYERRRQDGWIFYQKFRSRIVLDLKRGNLSYAQVFKIEKILSIAFDKIAMMGDWMTASYELSQVESVPDFVTPYFEAARDLIQEYISENYENYSNP